MGPEEQLRAFSSVVLPEETETPLDIVAKMVIVLINLGAHHLVQSYTDQLLDTDAEECGDLYLDVAENYMHVRLHGKALPFLEKLVHSETFGQVNNNRWRCPSTIMVGQSGPSLVTMTSPVLVCSVYLMPLSSGLTTFYVNLYTP